ncbi:MULTISPECIES: hypothetical protein [unclassified Thiocapsa]|uniref:hypothetical protein n=1 Tax=unclassified Thiocapsa TaxID=2641286 RepID=UPI0035AF616E
MSNQAIQLPKPHAITVQEYLRHLDVHRDPADGTYTTRFRVPDLSGVGIAALPGVTMDLRSLF